MARFVQAVPPPADPYTGDPLLRSWLDRLLGPTGHAAAQARLTALAADVTGPLRAAHADAEAHPPALRPLRPVGRAGSTGSRPPPAGSALRAAAARHAVVALPYLPEARASVGRRRPRASSTPCCTCTGRSRPPSPARSRWPTAPPRCCRRPEVDAGVRDAWLPRLISTDPDVAVTSGQWMTESQGGSDLSRSATDRPAGRRRLLAADRREVVLLGDRLGDGGRAGPARGRRAGSRVLAPFLVPRYAADSPLAGRRGAGRARARRTAAPAQGQARHPGAAHRRGRAARRVRGAAGRPGRAAAWPG